MRKSGQPLILVCNLRTHFKLVIRPYFRKTVIAVRQHSAPQPAVTRSTSCINCTESRPYQICPTQKVTSKTILSREKLNYSYKSRAKLFLPWWTTRWWSVPNPSPPASHFPSCIHWELLSVAVVGEKSFPHRLSSRVVAQ